MKITRGIVPLIAALSLSAACNQSLETKIDTSKAPTGISLRVGDKGVVKHNNSMSLAVGREHPELYDCNLEEGGTLEILTLTKEGNYIVQYTPPSFTKECTKYIPPFKMEPGEFLWQTTNL